MDVREFDFELPSDLIAQEPPADRTAARLLVVSRATRSFTHSSIASLPDHLQPGDVLVVNNTRVFPARLLGRRVPSGGAVECLLMAEGSDTHLTPGQGSDTHLTRGQVRTGPRAEAVW